MSMKELPSGSAEGGGGGGEEADSSGRVCPARLCKASRIDV